MSVGSSSFLVGGTWLCWPISCVAFWREIGTVSWCIYAIVPCLERFGCSSFTSLCLQDWAYSWSFILKSLLQFLQCSFALLRAFYLFAPCCHVFVRRARHSIFESFICLNIWGTVQLQLGCWGKPWSRDLPKDTIYRGSFWTLTAGSKYPETNEGSGRKRLKVNSLTLTNVPSFRHDLAICSSPNL